MLYLIKVVLFAIEYLILYLFYISYFPKREKVLISHLMILVLLVLIDICSIKLQLVNIIAKTLITILIGSAFFAGQNKIKGFVAISVALLFLIIETIAGFGVAVMAKIDATQLVTHASLSVVAMTIALFMKYMVVWGIRKKRDTKSEGVMVNHNIFMLHIAIPVASLMAITGLGYYLLTLETPDFIGFYLVIALLMVINFFHFCSFKLSLELLEAQIEN